VPAATIIEEVFGPAWKSQPPSKSFSIPMKTGTMYAESLAQAIPIDDDALAAIVKEYGLANSPAMFVTLLSKLSP
jgi:hypothetical protein